MSENFTRTAAIANTHPTRSAPSEVVDDCQSRIDAGVRGRVVHDHEGNLATDTERLVVRRKGDARQIRLVADLCTPHK